MQNAEENATSFPPAIKILCQKFTCKSVSYTAAIKILSFFVGY